MAKKFFAFRQNNSGGSFTGPAVQVFIEASNLADACQRTEPYFTLCGDSGLYAEYDSCGCCPCCGHRWSKPWDEEPESHADINTWIFENGTTYRKWGTATALIKADGSILIGDNYKTLTEIQEYVQSE